MFCVGLILRESLQE